MFSKKDKTKAYMHPNLAWSGIRVDTTSKLGILSFGPQIICALFQCTQLAPEIKTSSNSLRKYILRLNILIIFFGAHFMQYLDIYVYFRHNMSCNCSPEYRFFLLISSLLFSWSCLLFFSHSVLSYLAGLLLFTYSKSRAALMTFGDIASFKFFQIVRSYWSII